MTMHLRQDNILSCFFLALTWCLYFLATHEEVQEKLYQEFVDVLGDETITAQILPQLK
jgi:cytochrome P450 family 20 subfamily A